MRKIIYVLSFGNQWKVQCDHCNTGVFSTQSAAIKVARDHVGKLQQGTLSQILV